MAQIPIGIEDPSAAYKGPLMLASGYRPFFLMAAFYAVVALGVWLAALGGHLPIDTYWHGHEMVFGFGVAAISGFLMAATPKWTATPNIQGLPLAALIVTFLLGRIGFWAQPWTDALLLLDLLYLPLLGAFMVKVIIGTGNKRNYIVPMILFALAGANALFHFHPDSSVGLATGIYLIASLLALIGGRIIPAFTQNALRMKYGPKLTCQTPALLDKLSVPLVLGVAAAEPFQLPMLSGGLAAATGIVLLLRIIGWNSLKTFHDPLVWILHVAYLWLPLGFFAKAGTDLFDLFLASAALHALTAGAISLMIIAVASRAALGHSGRALKATPATVLAYFLLIGAAVTRVFLPFDFANHLAGGLWVLGWGVFAIAYWPVLAHPRIDGMPG